mmetsp:Transcript_6102/g.19139  ORF Transcript_6102/g.19139 Transcript_6102/m.19139 type:complete len:280 (-) Transcript_6102:450-1289(-)
MPLVLRGHLRVDVLEHVVAERRVDGVEERLDLLQRLRLEEIALVDVELREVRWRDHLAPARFVTVVLVVGDGADEGRRYVSAHVGDAERTVVGRRQVPPAWPDRLAEVDVRPLRVKRVIALEALSRVPLAVALALGGQAEAGVGRRLGVVTMPDWPRLAQRLRRHLLEVLELLGDDRRRLGHIRVMRRVEGVVDGVVLGRVAGLAEAEDGGVNAPLRRIPRVVAPPLLARHEGRVALLVLLAHRVRHVLQRLDRREERLGREAKIVVRRALAKWCLAAR